MKNWNYRRLLACPAANAESSSIVCLSRDSMSQTWLIKPLAVGSKFVEGIVPLVVN